MKTFLVAALFASLATPSLALGYCDIPRGGPVVSSTIDSDLGEDEMARLYEIEFRHQGIEATQVTFWAGCVQAVVREDGRNVQKLFNPWTLAEVPPGGP
ncbi:MAG: hypothetical protein ABIP15_04200 [Devosia sp.]